MNNQLIQDIKKKTDEEKMILQIKKNRLIKVIDAKEIEINQYKQKFKEIEIFVKRVCQMDEKYKKIALTDMRVPVELRGLSELEAEKIIEKDKVEKNIDKVLGYLLLKIID